MQAETGLGLAGKDPSSVPSKHTGQLIMTYSSNFTVSNAQSQNWEALKSQAQSYTQTYIYIHNVKEKLDIYIKSLIS